MKPILELVGTIFGALKSALIVVMLMALLAGNVLLVTSSSFHTLASSLLERLPIPGLLDNSISRKQKKLEAEGKVLQIENQKLVAEREARLKRASHARNVSRDVAKRTARNVGANLASMVGEATPYLGIGLVVASTALDVKDGCDTMRDVNEILQTLEEDQGMEDLNTVCGAKVPTVEELTTSIKETIGGTLYHAVENVTPPAQKLYDAIGGTTYHSHERIKAGAQAAYDALGGTLYEMFN